MRSLALDVEPLHSAEVVAVLEPAVLGVQTPAADVPALSDDHTLGAVLRNNDPGGDGVRFVLEVEDAVLRKTAHTREEELGLAPDEHRPPREIRVEPLGTPIIDREHVVARRLDQPEALQLVQLLRHLLRQVVRLAPVLGGVVELPDIVVERDGLLSEE